MVKTNVIYNENCLDGMKKILDKSIDMILCDLPYGETGHKWDKVIDLKSLFDEYRRIIKDEGCIALFGSFKFGVQLYNVAPDLYKYDWIWQKDNGTNFMTVHYQPFRIHESVFIFSKGRASIGKRTPMKYFPQKTYGKPYMSKKSSNDMWNGKKIKRMDKVNKDGSRFPLTIQQFCRDKEKIHPTQKPVALMEYLIKTYTKEGDVVLDNCIGSGSTAVACINTNRKFIGFELDRNYYDLACKRIEQYQI